MGRLNQRQVLHVNNSNKELENMMNKDINTLINELNQADIAEAKLREERLEKIFNEAIKGLK
ncbi:hypothetical protein N8072_00785 [bacterium]|jgi:hypothetical protein|nr:hypothetical protein [bacterium]MDB4128484.1 hypothetical protein [bacterium]MDC1257195.1 hypothetical protein [bacterium]